MQSLIRSKSAGVTGGRGTAGAGPGRDLLYMTDTPSRSPIGPICGVRTFGNRRASGTSIQPGHKHWDLDNFERLPVNMSSYSSTSAPSMTDLVIPTSDC